LKGEYSEGDSVYVGDSTTDILACLDADIGILFSPALRTKNFCEIFGIQLVPLLPNIESKGNNKLTLFTADSWADISDFLAKVV
jgi:hypothetical protein